MINQSWTVEGNLYTELSTLFNHRRMQERIGDALLEVQPESVEFTRQDDFFMVKIIGQEGMVYYGFAKRNPLDQFSVYEAKKVALYRLIRSIEESLAGSS